MNDHGISSDDTGLELVADLPPISLADINDVADLQRRVDRKYIVTAEQLADTVEHLAHRLAALDIDGRRAFAYESTYFDTDDLQSFHDAAHRRRRRFKVRTRSYLDTGTTMLEVKTRGGRGETVKHRQPHDFDDRTALGKQAHDFVDATLGHTGLARTLSPTLATTYRRTTLADLDDIARVTIDADLWCCDALDHRIGLPDRFVLETKSTSSPSATDHHLWTIGVRPESMSKYATGLAALDRSLPSNKWHRTLSRHFR